MLPSRKYRKFNLSDFVLLLPLAAVTVLLLMVLSSILAVPRPEDAVRALTSRELGYAVALSLLTSTTSTAAALAVAIPLAYALSRYDFKGKRAVEAILLLPFAMPPVALGAALLLFFAATPAGRAINAILNLVFEVPGLIVAQFAVICPLVIRVLKTSFDAIDLRYEAIARTLGYGKLSTIVKVVLPMSKGGILSAALLGFSRALGEFGASVTLAGATSMKTETLPIAVFLSLNAGELALTCMLILVLIATALVSVLAILLTGEGRVVVT